MTAFGVSIGAGRVPIGVEGVPSDALGATRASSRWGEGGPVAATWAIGAMC